MLPESISKWRVVVNIFKKIWSRRYVASLTKNEWHAIIAQIVSQSGALSEVFYGSCVASVNSNPDLKDANIINSQPTQESHSILNGFLSAQMLRYIKVANYISPSERLEFSRQFMMELTGGALGSVEDYYKVYEDLLDKNPLSLPATFLTDLFENIMDKKSPVDIAFYFMSQPTYEIFKHFIYFIVSNAFKDKYECEHIREAAKQYYQNALYVEYMAKLGLR